MSFLVRTCSYAPTPLEGSPNLVVHIIVVPKTKNLKFTTSYLPKEEFPLNTDVDEDNTSAIL